MSLKKSLSIALLLVAGATFAACGKSEKGAAAPGAGGTEVAGHSHEGWWCDEHGVPEEVCAQCDTKLVATFKAKGDWCEKHNRPDSQCFICHPEKPPKPELGGEEHKDKTPAKTS